MRTHNGDIRLSASDVTNHLACGHLTHLNMAEALGEVVRTKYGDPALDALVERGLRHEAAYLEHLRQRGLTVLELTREAPTEATLSAMQSGVDVIVQGRLVWDRYVGYADVLLKIAVPSRFGAWSYEVHDTKLSRETKAAAVVQLCLYSEMLEQVQGILPEHACVISPGNDFTPHVLRVADYLAYCRWVRGSLEAALQERPATYPEPVEHCQVCAWRQACDARWRADDHLSLVAGISRSQRKELTGMGVSTLASLGRTPREALKPTRGSADAMGHVREQARVQLEGRIEKAPVHELLLPIQAGRGLARLPAASPGDIFFDFEGDPFVEDGGLEYLWGYSAITDGAVDYTAIWALDRQAEKAAFVAFMSMLQARWQRHPDMHVYHYAPYEPSALKRLAGRFGIWQEELDAMLRAQLFVDLYGVVRQGLRASVESYSIKKLEVFFGYDRDVALPDVGPCKQALEMALELATPGETPALEQVWRDTVELYNRDDCRSAWALREWLENVRTAAIAQGHDVQRPPLGEGAPSEHIREESEATQLLRQRLTGDIPQDALELSGEQAARVLLADLLEFHRRESRASWWEFFRMQDLAQDDLLDERKAIAGLKHERRLPKVGKQRNPTDRYTFSPQTADVRAGDNVQAHGSFEPGPLGDVVACNVEQGWIEIKKTGKTAELHPQAVFVKPPNFRSKAPQVLARLAEWVADNGIDAESPKHRAARDLLLRTPPRLGARSKGLAPGPRETALQHACRIGLSLENGVLPLQGPPGAGKTFTAAHMILEMLQQGLKVGVTAVSHKVILNLLERVDKELRRRGVPGCIKRAPGSDARGRDDEPFNTVASAAEGAEQLANGRIQVLGGTYFFWSAEELHEAVDVMFIDEAGQLALANACALAQAAKSLILVGDPQQLEQPQKGAHPGQAGTSALQHLLGEQVTVSDTTGLFLAETYRLHPHICEFTSELFYAGRLKSAPGRDKQSIATPIATGAGLWWVPVQHEGNAHTSAEEVAAVAQLVARLTTGTYHSVEDAEDANALRYEDILIVAPYNAQVAALRAQLGTQAQVGTVDLFQGREAAVVIMSMTSSSAREAPRGMDFLYSHNRINVGTSRAKTACFLVAASAIFSPECRTPTQMRLANVLCRYRELADVVTLPQKSTVPGGASRRA